MTAHELARKLLAMADVKVVTSDDGYYNEIHNVEVTNDYDPDNHLAAQQKVVRLLRV